MTKFVQSRAESLFHKSSGGDQHGNLIAGTGDDDSGQGSNAKVFYTATESATYYVAAGAGGSSIGTYKLSVEELADDYRQDAGTAGTVAVGGSVTGDIQFAGDRDWFAVELEAGTIYCIDLEGSPTGEGTLGNPYLRGIHDDNGDLIADTANNDGGNGLNSMVNFVAPATATYYIAAGGLGTSRGTYKLSVTAVEDDYSADTGTDGSVTVGGSATGDIEYADDHDWFAVELEANTKYRIDLEGSPTGEGTLGDPYLRGIHDDNGDLIAGTANDDDGDGLNSLVEFVAPATATYYIAAGSYNRYWGPSRGTYKLSVTAVEDDYTADTGTTGAVTVGGSTTGELEYDGDRDWFAVALEADKTYRIDVKGDTADDYGGTLHNPSFSMHDSSGNAINLAADDNSGVGLNARLAAFAPDTDGTYYVEVGDPGGLGTYTVAVQEVTDSL